METDLRFRLHAYATSAEAQTPHDPPSLFADALAASAAAATAASAGIICSHTRELRGGRTGDVDELDALIAGKNVPGQPAAGITGQEPAAETASPVILPLPPGENTLENLALGAAGIPAIKDRNA